MADQPGQRSVRRSLFAQNVDQGPPTSVVVHSNAADICEVLARLVEAAGHRALRVAAPSEVAEVVGREGPDAVLLDAGPANLGVVRSLRSGAEPSGDELRIVSVEVGPASARLAWNAGVDAVLTRPFAATDVEASLAAVLARGDDERSAERQRQVAVLAG